MTSKKKEIYLVVTIYIFFVIAVCNVQVIHAIVDENILREPRDLKVFVFEDDSNNFLKLNVSWLPPNSSWHPKSYSISISTVLNEDNVKVDCPEESIFHTTKDNSQLSLVLPENLYLSDAPELDIRLKCKYEIQVIANPRLNFSSNSAKIIFTVPNCVGQSCGCQGNEYFLYHTPKMEVEFQKSKNFLIKWSPNEKNSTNVSYVISYAVPVLISNTGLPVYNTSRIATVSANTSSYLWKVESNDSFIKSGSKILLTPEDEHGCQGNSTVHSIVLESSIQQLQREPHYWSVWITILGACAVVFGALTFIWTRGNEKYKLMLANHRTTIPPVTSLSQSARWISSMLQNILYIHQEIETPAGQEANEFEISFKRLSFSNELGNGQFGRVHLGFLDADFPVAIKMSNPLNPSDELEARRQLIDEIDTMKRVGAHPHLVKLIGCCTSPENPICVVLEYIVGGDLLAYLHRFRDNSHQSSIDLPHNLNSSMPGTPYTTISNLSPVSGEFRVIPSNSMSLSNRTYVNVEDNRLRYSTSNKIDMNRFAHFALDIARGMDHLETCHIVHRDLAARNILITSDLTLKISDFGLSRNGVYVIGNGASGVRRLPARWMAPEALRDREFTSKSDVWSYGVVLWEIGTLGAFPYAEIHDDELLKYIVNDEGRLQKLEGISTELHDIISICWLTKPESRPKFHEIVIQLEFYCKKNQNSNVISNPCYGILSPIEEIVI